MPVSALTSAFTYSSGIQRIKRITNFLGVDAVLPPARIGREEHEAVCALVWGRKQTAERTRKWAATQNLPVWQLEDGFIRTAASNAHSRNTYSIVVDEVGIYYDANVPSALENFLNVDANFSALATEADLRRYIQRCHQKIVGSHVTKYNYCADAQLPAAFTAGEQPVILVIDQTRDDASVNFGGMSKEDFADMLDSAIDEHPHARVIVKTHPDVVAGRKQGYLTALAEQRSIPLLSESINPFSVLKQVNHVYCGTSQMGFEALLCGKPVTLFGLPFYAGWGVTDDRKQIPRRTASRSVEELFYASYDWYTRYCHPVTGAHWSLEQCIDHVILQKQNFERNARSFVGVGITPWKRRYVRQYLRSPSGSLTFTRSGEVAKQMIDPAAVAVTWNYRAIDASHSLVKQGNEVWRMEDGFLRSQGLGSDFAAPQSLVFDQAGLYFNSHATSDLEDLLNNHDCTLAEIHRASSLISLIISRRLSKYNVGSKNNPEIFSEAPEAARKLLVVGQVENDASLHYGCRDVTGNEDLLKTVREQNPEAWIVYKPHPDVVAGNREGAVSATVLEATVDSLCSDVDVIDCIDACDELHTMTSLSGFEALLRKKQVVTYGIPFYSGWGLTTDRHTVDRRSRIRTLEELVYCTLVAYPRYLDIETGEFITPEDLVVSVGSSRNMKKNKNSYWAERQVRKIKNVWRGLNYAP